MNVSAVGANASAFSRPLHTREDVATNQAQKTAHFQGRQASALANLAAAANVSISPEAMARFKADAQATEEAIRNGTLGAQYQAATAENAVKPQLEAMAARSPGVHALYTDPAANTQLTDFRSFFNHAKEGTKASTTALADALYDAVTQPSSSTDRSQAVDIALVREKLNVLNTQYVDEAHQADVALEIDHYIHRLLDQRENSIRLTLEDGVARAHKSGNTDDITNAEAALDAWKQGAYRTQQEMQQVLDITTTARDAQDMTQRLSQWADELTFPNEVTTSLINQGLAEWEQFVARHVR